jgi:hypothetical protein
MGVVHPGLGLGEGGVELRVTTVRREMFALAEGEDRIFQRAGAVEAPAVPGGGPGRGRFRGRRRGRGLRGGHRTLIFGAQGIRYALVEGLLVFRGMDDDLAGEAVAEGVEGARFLPSGVRGPVWNAWRFRGGL